jgi:hypothetical protein
VEVDPDRLRERYKALSTEELRRIAGAQRGDYTAVAQAVAASILATRRFERPADPEPAPTPDEAATRELWAALSVGAVIFFHFHHELFRAAKEAGVDADVLVELASAVVRSPWTYAILVLGVLFVLRHRSY